jgi:hypothetical protein
MTDRDQFRDRPGDEMLRLTVAEAADRLGITEAGVRKRIQRGQIPHERGDDGRLFVWISTGETRHAVSRDRDSQSRDELVEELRDRVRYLERQVEEERGARFRADQLLARLMERVPELEPPAPPETPEPREEPGPYRVRPERAEPAEPVEPVDPRREEPEKVEPQRVEPERTEPRASPVTAADEQQGRDPSPMLEARRRAHSARTAELRGVGGAGCSEGREQMSESSPSGTYMYGDEVRIRLTFTHDAKISAVEVLYTHHDDNTYAITLSGNPEPVEGSRVGGEGKRSTVELTGVVDESLIVGTYSARRVIVYDFTGRADPITPKVLGTGRRCI